MKRKLLTILFAAALTTAAVTGCQGGQSNNSSSAVPGQNLEVDDAGTASDAAVTDDGTAAVSSDTAEAAGTSNDSTAAAAASGTESTGTSGTQTSGGQGTGAAVTEEEAKQIALEDAGIKEADTQAFYVKYELDDGRKKYDVEFYADGMEYDYEIDADTGEIISFDQDMEYSLYNNGTTGTTSGTAGSSSTSQDILSEEEVAAIALERVPGADASHLRLELDRDDGRVLYEGQIIYNGVEYEFEIDGQTGNVIEWSEERY